MSFHIILRRDLSIILGVDFEIALGMEADRTNLWSFRADTYMTAITALPNRHATFAEHFVRLHILQQCAVTLLMMFLNGSDTPELLCKAMEALLFGLTCESVVHVGPFVVLPFGGMLKIDGRIFADLQEPCTKARHVLFHCLPS